MPSSLMSIADKARSARQHRFENLSSMVHAAALRESYRKLNRRSATGVDGVTYAQYGQHLHAHLTALHERLKQDRYRSKHVRRVYIPKASGGQRALGIPALEDKIVQQTVADILTAIYDNDFLPSSYGYRPGRGAHAAVKDLHGALRFGNYHYVVEADIRDYFGSIDHDMLLKMLSERLADRRFLGLIRTWLRAGILERDGRVVHPGSGTPQGGVISPILANIYLHHVLNRWFAAVRPLFRGQAKLWVYADDFVAAFEHEDDAQRFYRTLGKRLAKFNLQVAPEKTRLLHFSREQPEQSEAFSFLGFEFRWVRSARDGTPWIKHSTDRKKMQRSVQNIKQWCRRRAHIGARMLIEGLNRKLRGYDQYYGVYGNMDQLTKLRRIIRRIVFTCLNRRSQKRSYTWQGFRSMLRHCPLCPPQIHHFWWSGTNATR